MENLIIKANQKLSRVSIRAKKNSLFLRGVFPPKNGDGVKPKQYEFSLKCKALPEQLKIALAKAQEIESKLILDKWVWEEKQEIEQTVFDVLKDFEINFWGKKEKTPSSLHYWKIHQMEVFSKLPQNKIFDEKLIRNFILSTPPNSYKRFKSITYLKSLAIFKGLNIDFHDFGNYTKKPKKLPLLEDIIHIYCSENNLKHKWIVGVLFTFGLRPHELFRSKFKFDNFPPLVLVGDETKTGSRTSYPIFHPDIDVLSLPIPEFYFEHTTPNQVLGHKIAKIFNKYPITAYQLRHYYAVRGAMEGLSPVTVSKWMGHSLKEHFHSYASLLGDLESEKLWIDKFST